MNEVRNVEALSRRSAVMRLLGTIVGFIGVVLGAPLVVFLFGPAIRGRYEWRWLGQSIPPTLAARAPWVRVGSLDSFRSDTPMLVTLSVPVQDGWIQGDAPIAVYVRRTGTDQAAIYDIHCTHMGCSVAWNSAARRFFCPCHGGVYDPSGAVVSGPPPRPLDQYATKVEQGVLYMGHLTLRGA
jgi:menaquinol-cytochrome c reductase iron-sulfur subunit